MMISRGLEEKEENEGRRKYKQKDLRRHIASPFEIENLDNFFEVRLQEPTNVTLFLRIEINLYIGIPITINPTARLTNVVDVSNDNLIGIVFA